MSEKTLIDFRDLSYDTGYLAGRAEAGDEIDEAHQKVLIAKRNALQAQLKKALAEAGSKTEIERLLEKITNPVYEVIDEHGEIWWTMPKKVLFGIFAGFGYTLKEQEDKT